jgi:radical SAM superfamily enzyme YgiQ (UPF0313 family)
MKVVLVQPNYRVKKDASIWGVSPPMGLCYLASMLEKYNIPVEILDTNADNLTAEEAGEEIMRRGADIVGISMLTPVHNFSVELAGRLPSYIIKVAGGPHASSLPEEMLRSGFDIVVRGEGEYPFLDIALGRRPEEIKGISFMKRGEVIHNEAREMPDPDTLPFPARHLLRSNGCNMPYYSEGTALFPWAQVYSSRGCPWDCCYCNKTISGRRFRPRSPENVMSEIGYLVERLAVKEIDFSDDVFNLDKKRAMAILDMIIRSGYRIYIRFSNGLRIDCIDEELLYKMKKAGVGYIAYGIESGSQKIIDRIPKRLDLKKVRDVVEMTRKTGIEVTGFFMFGLLGDTEETMEETIRFAAGLNLDVALFNIAIPYPGTRMYDEIRKKGKILIDDWSGFYHTSGKMIYEMDGMASPDAVERMYRKAVRTFYLRPFYIARKLTRAVTRGELKRIIKGVRRVLYSQR